MGVTTLSSVTPHVTKILIKLLKMQLSLKAKEDQAIEDANQNLNYPKWSFDGFGIRVVSSLFDHNSIKLAFLESFH
jgi:hypothetical protein